MLGTRWTLDIHSFNHGANPSLSATFVGHQLQLHCTTFSVISQWGDSLMMIPGETDDERLPFRHFSVDGWHVYIGKNDEQNDELTTRFARSSDVWMHVSSQAGSHVIVRGDDRASPAPAEVLQKAASLAAWFSKARNAPWVKVDVTEARNVFKPKNAPPGEVRIGKFKTIKIKPVSPQVLFPEGSDT
jgi:hypothetical protein